MSRKTNTLIIALGVLVLLGAVYYWSIAWNRKKADSALTPYTPYTPSPNLGNLQGSELVKIEVNGLTLEKNNGLWKLVSIEGGTPPGGIELDQSRIQYMSYSLASIWVDQVIDEAPPDVSQYGLDKPYRASVTDSDGQKAEYLLGGMTPSRTSYYVMQAGDPKVYSISTYTAEYMQFTLDSIRERSLFPSFESFELTQLLVESSRFKRIEISIKPEKTPLDYTGLYSTHFITSPYTHTRGVDNEAFEKLLEPFMDLEIVDFVDDAPSSLKPYGLDDPVRVFLQTEYISLDLLIGGNDPEGKRYAKLAGAPGVFTLYGMESIVNVKPFTLINKFALLVFIDSVDHLSVNGGEKYLSADFRGTGDNALYYLNGKKTEMPSFKTFYQAVIGLMVDAEYPGPVRQSDNSGELTIEYRLNNPPGERLVFTLIPYNRDFYALKQEGTTEFLISRNQVRRIYETADAVIYDEN